MLWPFYMDEIEKLLEKVRHHFAALNEDENLTAEDKKQLKEFYLHNFIAPEARKLIKEYFPDPETSITDPQENLASPR